MPGMFYTGRRLSYDGALCTVRYIGPLEGTSGEWLGVEWDDPTRGKHDGKYKGQQIFQCLSTALTAGSFVKSSRKIDTELTVVEAIRSKYGNADSTDLDIVIISGKIAEEVGFGKIAQEQARLAELRIVLIDQMVVNGIATRGASHSEVRAAQEDLHIVCPNIYELDLGWNTFESWADIAPICAALPKLKVLKVGAFSTLSHVSLEECSIKPNQLFDLLGNETRFAGLECLDLSANCLSDIQIHDNVALPRLPSVKTLDLSNNRFRDLGCMMTLREVFPNIQSISLQANIISSISSDGPDLGSFSKIHDINLSQNVIPAFDFVDALPRHFPDLRSLHITQNPFFSPAEDLTDEDPRASDKRFYLTVARIASLQVLNHAKISARDREEGEIYYLSVSDKAIKQRIDSCKDRHQTIEQARTSFPRYEQLAKKYHHESLIEKYLSNTIGEGESLEAMTSKVDYPAGSLGARLVNATFYIKGQVSDMSTVIRFPSSVPVTRVMAILTQNAIFKDYLRPLQFRMIYESEELDPVDTTAESTTRSATYGRRLTPEQRKALWQEWGDWDADAIVEQFLHEKTLESGPGEARESEEHWIEDGKVCVKQGRRFKPREIEIPPALKRPWGDWLEGSKQVRIRIEPFERSL